MADEATCSFGVTGLAVMGANVARNVASRGRVVAVHNRHSDKTTALVEEYGDAYADVGGRLVGADSLEAFVALLERPRKVLVMVKAGAPVDAVLEVLVPLLDEGDVVLDGGNSHFADTRRRAEDLAARGLLFMGTGISGGEEGALKGPSIMPGGPREAWDAVGDVLQSIAAVVDGEPCCTWIGPDAAGHYVKMVHNGIEYADIQLIVESYDLMQHLLGMDTDAMASTFEEWNSGDLDSFLIEITAKVLAKRDETGNALVDAIIDEAEQKGTGRWTSQHALELGVPVTAITEAVFARALSARREERGRAADALAGPTPHGDHGISVDDIRQALYASKIVAYAQGFAQLQAASEEFGWDLHLADLATIWRGGCIIRATFLDRIREAYADADAGSAEPLLLLPYFRDAVADAQDAWRRVVAAAVTAGVPVPAFASSLAWYDGYRARRSPANLIQGLRDYFGAHTYRRLDREGTFHTRWPQDGVEVEA